MTRINFADDLAVVVIAKHQICGQKDVAHVVLITTLQIGRYEVISISIIVNFRRNFLMSGMVPNIEGWRCNLGLLLNEAAAPSIR